MRILVTGSAGYIGSFIIKRLLKDGVEKIIAVDLLPQPKQIPKNEKLVWLTCDISREGWEGPALKEGPIDAILHLAFKIRNPYGRTKETQDENLAASKNMFELAFKNKIPRLIYTSSVAAYGAKQENIGRLLREIDPLKEDISPYGVQKRLVEEMLRNKVAATKPITQTMVVRLNSVTGPIGQNTKGKFGLITFLKKLLPFVVETDPAWARQFIHERDVEEIFVGLLRSPIKHGSFDVYNAAPPSYLTAKDIARVLGKKTIKIPRWLVRPLFWLTWNLTLGKIPTHPDSANGLIYPINVDGSKIQEIGFNYKFRPEDALLGKN